MRLYHHPMSSNARRAVMTAIHLGVNHERVLVDLAKGEQKTPEYLAKNPNGRVPTLDVDGFYLTESHAIMQFLADRTPGQTVFPREPIPRADVTRWMFWNAHHWAPAVAVLGFENMVKRFRGMGDADPREVQRGEALITQCARVLDAHLADRTWIAQGQLTLADIAIATPLMATVPAKLPVTEYAHLQRWFARVRELDAWKQTDV
jgi:glutathione S-transferase